MIQILIVEDERPISDLIRLKLTRAGYACRTAFDGEQAAEQWAESQGISAIRLNSGSGRTGAHQFYRAIGFTEEKEQKRFIKNL